MPRITRRERPPTASTKTSPLPPHEFDIWTDTEIPVLKGESVAFMAEGQILDSRQQRGYTQPHGLLWLKIGKDGSRMPIFCGYTKKPLNMSVIKAEGDCSLYYRTALRNPDSRIGSLTLNVIVRELGDIVKD